MENGRVADVRVVMHHTWHLFAGGAGIPPCGTVKKPGQAVDRTR